MATAGDRVRRARDVPDLLAALQAADPGRPRLTWYGADGERVELSARVLATWVAKTANLLVEELDAEPGTTVRLDLPAHWRTVVWALATWSAGAELVPDGAADVLVTAQPSSAPRGAGPAPGAAGPATVAVALPALARAFPGDLGGALDYASVVAGFGDVFAPTDPPSGTGLLDAARSRWPHLVRLLGVGGLDLVGDLLGALLADGSLVLCEVEPAPEVVAAERVTARAP
jgi:uncharacterized protein (TIGR03089 family)